MHHSCARASCTCERAVGHPSVPQRGTKLARSGRRKANSQTPTALPRRTVARMDPMRLGMICSAVPLDFIIPHDDCLNAR